MKTTTKVILGVSAAAAGLYIGTAIAKSYRAFLQEHGDAKPHRDVFRYTNEKKLMDAHARGMERDYREMERVYGRNPTD